MPGFCTAQSLLKFCYPSKQYVIGQRRLERKEMNEWDIVINPQRKECDEIKMKMWLSIEIV